MRPINWLEVACPQCGAEVGEPCVDHRGAPSEEVARATHAERMAAHPST
ncbi:MAG: hypothetical protein QOG53_2559 [Frankiales bacterium]|jgi:hypothetical protein|nr:hypothetical protein [Frankiales bacterium]